MITGSGDRFSNPALTGIRAVACLWVVSSHMAVALNVGLSPILLDLMSPGFLGVDLFFVLSGFILACVHADLSLRPLSVVRFYLKRVCRIYPLNFAVMFFMAANAWRIGVLGSTWYDTHHFLPYLFMVANFYTDPPITGWLATNWSLGVELVCYIFFPLLVRVLCKLPVGVCLIIVLALLVGETQVQRDWLGMSIGRGAMLRGAVGFSLGAAAALLTKDRTEPDPWTASVMELACVAGIAACVLDQVLWLIAALMGCLIIAVSRRSGVLARLLATRPAVWLGDISFSIYLVHGVLLGEWGQPWLAAMRATVPEPAVSLIWAAGFLAATISISAFTYYAVEVPCRRLGGRAIDHLGTAGLLSREADAA